MKPVSFITPGHLLQSLFKNQWFSRQGVSKYAPWKIGVCVSGGPDSMALAYLLQHMPHPSYPNGKAFSPYAFVIDHGARDGSEREALWVKNQLQGMGVPTVVEQLQWPPDIDPKSVKGFESAARAGRYRALAKLAEIHEIQDLFSGHHLDDQVETFMYRLLRDQSMNPASFRGMTMSGSLPNSQEVYRSSSRSLPLKPTELEPQSYETAEESHFEIYHAGFQLHRVLLDYTKQQLINTCVKYKIPFVQDKTNADPSVTARNAIRYLRAKHDLPKALTGSRLLAASHQVGKIMSKIEGHACSFAQHIESLDMHNQTGLLLIRLYAFPGPLSKMQFRGFSFFIQKLLALISPLHNDLPELLDQDLTEQILALIMGGAAGREKGGSTATFHKVTVTQMPYDHSLGTFPLQFTRQGMSSREVQSLVRGFEIFPQSNDLPSLRRSYPVLWDRRFWISINGDVHEIATTTLECYTESHAVVLKQSMKERGLLEQFEKKLATYAPARCRFTLPVLVNSGKPIALPTLDLSISQDLPVGWQVSYARNNRAMNFLFPDLHHRDLISWSFEKFKNSETQKFKTIRGSHSMKHVGVILNG